MMSQDQKNLLALRRSRAGSPPAPGSAGMVATLTLKGDAHQETSCILWRSLERGQLPSKVMKDRTGGLTVSREATAELNRVVAAVTAELAARRSNTNDAATLRTNRRFAKAKAARVSEAAGIANTAARELTAAKASVLDKVAEARAAGFTVDDDFSVADARTGMADRTTEADRFAADIQAAVTELVDLDEEVASRLLAAAKDLEDFSDH